MTRTPSLRRLIVPFVVGALALSTIVPTAIARDPNPNKKPKDPVSVQILGLNDYHGQLEPLVATATGGGRIGSLTDTNPDPTHHDARVPARDLRPGGRDRIPGDPRGGAQGDQPELRVRVGRRPHRRDPAAVRPVPRRAERRGLQHHGSRLQRRREPRVRRGDRRAPSRRLRRPHRRRLRPGAAGRVPPGRWLRRRRPVPRRGLPVPRRERDLQDLGRHHLPALRRPRLPGRRQGRLRRDDPPGHAGDRLPGRHRHRRLQRRGRLGQRARAVPQAAWRRGHRRPAP